MEEREKLLNDVIKAWNSLVKGLIQAENGWKKYSALCLDNNVGIEEFPLDVQKIFYRANPKGEFDFIIEDFITTGRGAKDFLIKLIRKKEEDNA